MFLKEFFGAPINTDKISNDKDRSSEKNNDLFWYILDHDKLHKDYLLPLARSIKEEHSSNNLDKEKCIKKFMPMVEKGCLEYYHKKDLKGRISKHFPKKLRKDLCEKLFNHFYEDIIKDCYTLGS